MLLVVVYGARSTQIPRANPNLSRAQSIAVAVTGYYRVGERLSVLERNAELSAVQIEANSEFRILWPRGELGSLPADAEQFMMLEFHQLALDEIRDELDGQ